MILNAEFSRIKQHQEKEEEDEEEEEEEEEGKKERKKERKTIFPQQIGITFKEETNKKLHFERNCI